ncbi:hypothetical protein K8R03_00075 [Candidatus Kaiserbacteria bacterium]|nr:hypothetical protein [Candidatus Kaiserbacteria bacterium]
MAQKKKSGGKAGAIATAGALAAAGALAGYYFYASKDAKKHRKIASKWANDLKKDIVTQTENLKNIDKTRVHAIIEKAAKGYSNMKNLDGTDLSYAVKELKTNWRAIADEVKSATKDAKTSAKKSVKKVAKKVAKKA